MTFTFGPAGTGKTQVALDKAREMGLPVVDIPLPSPEEQAEIDEYLAELGFVCQQDGTCTHVLQLAV